jgi:hypothetical protein
MGNNSLLPLCWLIQLLLQILINFQWTPEYLNCTTTTINIFLTVTRIFYFSKTKIKQIITVIKHKNTKGTCCGTQIIPTIYSQLHSRIITTYKMQMMFPKQQILCLVDHVSWIICTPIITNSLHCLSLVYWTITTPHVLGVYDNLLLRIKFHSTQSCWQST